MSHAFVLAAYLCVTKAFSRIAWLLAVVPFLHRQAYGEGLREEDSLWFYQVP